MAQIMTIQLCNLVTKTVVFGLLLGTLSSCQEPTSTANKARVDERDGNITPISSVLDMFSCKPAHVAFVAAHRGTVEASAFPENALQSLQALHANGVPFAEIDVARLKDGTQILFHDGVWDKRSTGTGPIVASDWDASQKLLLKDTNGQLTSIRPSRFEDVLAWAKNRMYLEIDFKSSADPAQIISAIRAANMINQVILISYNTDQAVSLHKLAPKAALSVGISKIGDVKALEARGIPTEVMTAWTGGGPLEKSLAKSLRAKNIPILAASFFDLDEQLQKSGDFEQYVEFARLPDLVVSDQAYAAQGMLSIKGEDLMVMEACLRSR
ncbi:MAG: hypothetical protein COA69_10535 [Robiginitomaculum sp.]|nr:MAG: hypothetical protein COA69_10535 [Robiginitomaculum sp.]